MRFLPRALLCATLPAVAMLAVRAGAGLATTDASAARLGYGSVVLVGEGEVLVGEPANNFRPGTVYVFRKNGGAWREALALTAPDAAVYDRFGSSLALEGARLFVGAGPSALHVFSRQGAAWVHGGSVEARQVPEPEALFGDALAAAGEWLFVGRAVAMGGRGRGGGAGRGGLPQEGPPGAVYVFRRGPEGGYAHHQTLASPEAARAGDGFGSAVAVRGGTALVGAPGQDGRAGVVHEFSLDASGSWTWARSFAPTGLSDGDAFGTRVALAGERAVASAPGDAGGHGAVYVFRRTVLGTGAPPQAAAGAPAGSVSWQELARIAAPAGRRTDGFGSALAADDREVWVGAPGAGGSGGTWVLAVDDEGPEPGAVQFLSPSGPALGAGRSVSLRGDVAAVGATVLDPTLPEGVVIYERAPDGGWRADPMILAALDELPAVTGGEVQCGEDGRAADFDCGNVQLLSFLPPSSLTHDARYVQMNDIWGWTDEVGGRDWAIIGRRDGTTFVDVTDPANPVPVADLPMTEGARANAWRDIKVYRDHAYVVADGAGPHGMQIFDLTRLRSLAPVDGQPVLVQPDTTYREINSAHNIVINEETGYAYSVGSSGGGTTCAGGLHMIDIREPKEARFAGCFFHPGTGRQGGGYTHDAQCLLYRGPDERYHGREICIGANETAISVADVTDKENPVAISQASYPRVAYAHQGWFTEDQRYWFMNDEGDEIQGVPSTRTLVWDLEDLENPRLAREHLGVEAASDHNLYIRGNLMYQANYRSGLRILDVSDPENPYEVGFFDTAPFMGTDPGFNGAWSVYPFFRSGTVVVSSIEQGLFILRYSPVAF